MVLPCSCIRAKNNVSSFVFSNDTDVNMIDHTYLDEVHRNSFSSGSLYTLDHTIITNQSVHCLFGGVQLSNKIGSLVPPSQSVIVNDSIMTAVTNDVKCTIPSTLLFIQHATNMSELTYGDLKKLMSNWSKPNDMRDYMLAWTKMYKAECYRISYTIMKDLIQEMETIEYNQKESSVCSRKQGRLQAFPRKIITTVVSSTTFSASNQRFHAIVQSRSTASYTSLRSPTLTSGCSQSSINLITSCEGMNSHSPSLPITITRSSSVRSLSVTSGVLITPTECATVSHSERDIASPGMSWSANQTRAGPS